MIQNQIHQGPLGLPPSKSGEAVGTAQTLGLRSRIPWSELLADNRKIGVAPQAVGQSKPAKTKGTTELSFIGVFENPWRKTPAKEAQAILAQPSPWEPSVDDFAAVAGKDAIKVKSFLNLLGAVFEKPPGSVKAVNIFTHANRGFIAFAGTIKPGSITADVQLYEQGALTENLLEKLPEMSLEILDEKTGKVKKKFTLEDVRARLASEAQINLFACHSGQDRAFLQTIADVFGVKVTGFQQVVRYDIKVGNGGRIERNRIGLGLGVKGAKGSTAGVANYHQLLRQGLTLSPRE